MYPLDEDKDNHHPLSFADTTTIIDIGEALPLSSGEEVWMIDSLFPEVPFGEGGLFSARGCIAESDLISPWRVTGKGKWNFGERILELEARALVLGLESLIAEGVRNSRNLFLIDNTAFTLSFARGRCNNYMVLRQIRRFRALLSYS